MKISILEKVKGYAEFPHAYPYGRSEGDWLRPKLLDGVVHGRTELVGDIREAEVKCGDTATFLHAALLAEVRLHVLRRFQCV